MKFEVFLSALKYYRPNESDRLWASRVEIFLPRHVVGQYFSSKLSFPFIPSSTEAENQTAVFA